MQYQGRAGRTGQSESGECYVIAHEKDMKPVNSFRINNNNIIFSFLFSFERCYSQLLKIILVVTVIYMRIITMLSNNFYSMYLV